MSVSSFGMVLLLAGSAWILPATTIVPGYTQSTIVGTGIAIPTGMAVAPDGRVFVTQQSGQLRVIQGGVLQSGSAISLAVDSSGERGLIGVALDPNFSSNGFVYLHYTVPAGVNSAHNRVSRFTLNGNTVVANSEVPVLDLEPLAGPNHNGGMIGFGPDGKLYVGVGDNVISANAQSLGNKLGKVLRLNPNGTVPLDNPFVGVAGASGEIYAYGLRNPYQFAFDPVAGALFINDVGQNALEEIDVAVPGGNFGWPVEEGPGPNPQLLDPLFSYGHIIGPSGGCAITGGAFFLQGYFFADLCSGWIRQLSLSGPAVATDFLQGGSQIVSLANSADGLYYLQRGSGTETGGLFLITAAAPEPKTLGLAAACLGLCLAGWKRRGEAGAI